MSGEHAPSRRRTIILCEPFCVRFEHASFNAALAQTLLHAYPEDRCVFIGEASHLRCVSEIIRSTSPQFEDRLTWKPLEPGERILDGWRLFLRAWRLARTMTTLTEIDPRVVVYSSATELDALALKLALLLRVPSVPYCAILHGVLRRSLVPSRPKKFAALRGLRFVFRVPHPRGLRFLALGQPILEELREVAPAVLPHFRSFDIPYVWRDHAAPPPPARGTHPVFGYLGVSATAGFESFLQIVAESQHRGIPAEFRVVGRVLSDDHRIRLSQMGVDAPNRELSNDEYADRARALTFALWTIPEGEYRLTASTSFLEELSLVRPGIHLRNPYLQHYFEQMGDIGYLCDSPGEIVQLVSDICAAFPAERYRRQCETILSGRMRFEPAVVASQLHEIITELTGELPA